MAYTAMSKDGPSFLNWRVHDALQRFSAAPPAHKFSRAQKLIEAKFARGDFNDVLQALDDDTRDALARALVSGRSNPGELAGAIPPRTSS